MTAAYRVTSGAREVLIGIWLYSVEAWGEAQADHYQDRLHSCCADIASGRARTKPVAGLTGMSVTRCEHHYIFSTVIPDAGVIILAVFHERMDFVARLADRLN